MEFAKWLTSILYNPIALLGLICLLLLLDKIKAYEKLKNWFKPPMVPHRREEDEEGSTHFHKRENQDSLKVEIESLRRLEELNAGRIVQLESLVSGHHVLLDKYSEKKVEEEIVIGILKNEQVHFTEKLRITDANVEKLFVLISNLKDSFIELHKTMIEMGIGKK